MGCTAYCVQHGSVLIGVSNALGKTSILARLTTGQWLGELALFDGGARTHDVYADECASLWHIPAQALRTYLRAQPDLWRSLGQLLAAKTRRLMEGLSQQTLMSPENRMAQRLLLLAQGSEQLRFSQEELAGAIGISRQTCNAILKHLAQQGLIQVERNGLRLLDQPGLAKLSQG